MSRDNGAAGGIHLVGLDGGRLGAVSGRTLKSDGGDGTSGGMETWQQSVDRRLAQAETDARSLLKYGVSAVVALAVMIAGLYLYIGAKNEALASQIASVQVQQAHVEDKLDRVIDALPKK